MASSFASVLSPTSSMLRSRALTRMLPLRLNKVQGRIPQLLVARSVASAVSNKPGSQTLPHAYQNVKEETGNSARDFAKAIAGNVGTNLRSPAEALAPINDTFVGITRTVAADVPRHILVMGLTGSMPYIGTSMCTLYLAYQARLAAAGVVTSVDPCAALNLLTTCMNVQITYGAVLISFAGALHWGMEFAAYNGQKGYARLLLGAAPVVYAWSTLALEPHLALVAQWVGYTSLWYGDMKATSAGWTPKWYSQYRFYLSLIVGTCIVGTLAGTSYFGPSPGHDEIHHSLEEIRAARQQRNGDLASDVPGAIEAVPIGEDGGRYVKIKKRNAENGGDEEGEESK